MGSRRPTPLPGRVGPARPGSISSCGTHSVVCRRAELLAARHRTVGITKFGGKIIALTILGGIFAVAMTFGTVSIDNLLTGNSEGVVPLILADASFTLPLVIWLLAGFIREIPRSLEEAAAVDGADRLAALRWVVLPLVAPGMASGMASGEVWNSTKDWYSDCSASPCNDCGLRAMVPWSPRASGPVSAVPGLARKFSSTLCR